jgi:hypothetical protein
MGAHHTASWRKVLQNLVHLRADERQFFDGAFRVVVQGSKG